MNTRRLVIGRLLIFSRIAVRANIHIFCIKNGAALRLFENNKCFLQVSADSFPPAFALDLIERSELVNTVVHKIHPFFKFSEKLLCNYLTQKRPKNQLNDCEFFVNFLKSSLVFILFLTFYPFIVSLTNK